MSVMQRVREAIEPSHQAIEQTDFSKSLMDGRISRAAYCQYLAQMWHIHYRLEHTLPGCELTGKYFENEMIRTPNIERDLFALVAPWNCMSGCLPHTVSNITFSLGPTVRNSPCWDVVTSWKVLAWDRC